MNLTKKYRLIWDISTLIIQNEYERDCTGSLTIIVDNGKLGIFESNIYQDILDKIEEEGLLIPEDPTNPEDI